jgi:hypothetical protein
MGSLITGSVRSSHPTNIAILFQTNLVDKSQKINFHSSLKTSSIIGSPI